MRWSNDASAKGSASADASTSSTRSPKRRRATGEHLGALVEPRHAVAAARAAAPRRGRFRSRRRARVPPSRGTRDDEEPAPARVLAERQRRADAVVASGRAARRAARAWRRRSDIAYPASSLSWRGDAARRPRAHRGGRGGAHAPTASELVSARARGRAGRRRCASTSARSRRRTARARWLALDDDGEPVADRARRPGRRRDRGALRDRRGVRRRRRPRRAPRAARRRCG